MKLFIFITVAALSSISFAASSRFTCGSLEEKYYFEYNGKDLVKMYNSTASCDMKLDPNYKPTHLIGFVRFEPTTGYGFCKAKFDPIFQTGRLTIDQAFLDKKVSKTQARLNWTGDGQSRDTKITCWQ